MTNDLAKTDDEQATDVAIQELDELLANEVDPDEVGFLNSIRFFSARATECQRGERDVNSFAVLNEGQFERSLGKEITVCFITKRDKAVYTTKDGYGTTYQVDSDGWKTAVADAELNNDQATAKQRELGQDRFPRMYGAEWLVYCPDTDEFYLWYYGANKTMRKDGTKQGDGRRGKTYKVGHRMCKHASGPYATPQYTPVDDEDQINIKEDLSPQRVINAIKRFKDDAIEFVPRPQAEGQTNDDDDV